MREEANNHKSSWPKMLARKWLNAKTSKDEFHCDYKTKESTTKPNDGNGQPGCDQMATSSLNLRAFVGTWNVGGKSPDNNVILSDWLRIDNAPADIYVLGFQEIVPLNAGNVLGPEDSGPAKKWLSLIHGALNGITSDEPRISSSDLILFDDEGLDNFSSLRSSSCSSEDGLRSFGPSSYPSPVPECAKHLSTGQHKYSLAASKQMVGIFLCVWIREELTKHVRSTKVSLIGTGIMGCLGNKGSVSISMKLHEATFCFVCSHLASGEKEGDAIRRNLDVEEILRRTRFANSLKIPGKSIQPNRILDHDNIIWLGDLNYRLASICCNTYKLLDMKDWQALLEKDQLRIEQRAAGGVFKGWKEGDICFAPTYKYLSNSDNYVVHKSTSSKEKRRRTPAWCDRILWKGGGLKQICYLRGESRFSDHRPVYSLFSIQMHQYQQQQPREA